MSIASEVGGAHPDAQGEARRLGGNPGCRKRAAQARLRAEPEKTLLHEVVRTHLETFLAELREDELYLPRYVEMEFRRFIACGVLEEGFCRCTCEDGGDEVLIAFSCKVSARHASHGG